jgi:hypothetical protein
MPKDIKKRAMETASDNEIDGFMASDPWLDGFMKRNNFSLWQRTNMTTLSDDKLLDPAFQFMKFL